MNLKKTLIAAVVLCMTLTYSASAAFSQTTSSKPRIIITCDPECDDNNSLIHFLLRSCDFNVSGIVYASSRYHWKGNGTGERRHVTESSMSIRDFGYRDNWRWSEGFIENAVDAYAQCYDNLKVHHPDYPNPTYLKSIIRYGNIYFEGDYSSDTPGSNLIRQCILDDVPGKLYVTVWGGASTVARALKSIEEQYRDNSDWKQMKDKISHKLVICMALDQDGAYPCYIQPVWPDVNILQGSSTGLMISYYPQLAASGADKYYYSPEWMGKNISSKGIFGQLTRVWGDGKQLVKGDICDCFGEADKTKSQLREKGYVDCYFDTMPKGSFLGEGDTYSFLNLIDNGLCANEDDSWGGWAGRTVNKDKDITANFSPTGKSEMDSAYKDFHILPAYMNSLATRYAWSVTSSYKKANHEPVISAPLEMEAHPGQNIAIKASVKDPDGNKISLKWWLFKVGTYHGDAVLTGTDKSTVKLKVPADAKAGQTIHIILSATDNAPLPLTRYHRVVINIK